MEQRREEIPRFSPASGDASPLPGVSPGRSVPETVVHGGRITLTWLRHTLRAGQRSLRGRLLYALGALLLLLLALSLEQAVLHASARRELVLRADRDAAQTAASALRARLDELFRLEETVARTALGGPLGSNQVPGLLQQVKEQYGSMASLRLVSADGMVRYGYPAAESTQGGFLATEEPFYRQVLSGPTRVFTQLVPGNATSVPRFQLASRVTATGTGGQGGTETILTLVCADFYDYAFQELLPKVQNGRSYVLVDPSGQIGYRSPTLSEARWLVMNDQFRATLKERRPTLLEGRSNGGVEMVGAAVPVPDSGWSLALVRPKRDFLAEVEQDARSTSLTMLLVVAAFGVGIFALVSVSFRPVNRLSAAARKLGTGDFSLRLPPAEVQEFEAVVESFNRMVERLQAAQEQLEASRRHLEDEVRDRTEELRSEHDKLIRAERLSTVGMLSSAIAHDLRNPLSTVGMALYSLRTRLDEEGAGKDPRVLKRLDTAEKELKRAEQIISTLLAFARTGEPKRAPVALNELVGEVLEVVDFPPTVQLRMELDPHAGEVSLDRSQMFQVLENLLRNAVQAVGEAGEIRLTSQRTSEQCVLTVGDSGPGIPADQIASIFEPLVTTKATGTGIGLALCKRVVDAHGGRISATRGDGPPERPGATFRIELPLGG